MRFWILAILISWLVTSTGLCADFTECFQKNTREMGTCFYEIQLETEKALKAEITKIIKEISTSTYTPKSQAENNKLIKQVLEAFQESQRQWDSFRDSDCKFIRYDTQWGSMQNVMQLQCQIVRTEQRINNLKNWRNWQY